MKQDTADKSHFDQYRYYYISITGRVTFWLYKEPAMILGSHPCFCRGKHDPAEAVTVSRWPLIFGDVSKK